ncbi:MAG: LPS export ABC transporter permease LptG [Rhodospirillales bacterium]|nr:MAG: LPS export ABC transporter permease LptG [Rhodospirillales bacterium]
MAYLSRTLIIYLARQYVLAFLVVLGAFLFVILLADTIELLRRTATKDGVSLSVVFEMALLKLPFLGQQAFPFAGLFAAMAVFWRLSRSNELVVIRAAGTSAWQFLLGPLAVAILFGVLQATAISPLASATLARFERIEAISMHQRDDPLFISGSGLWLRQASPEGQSVIHASRVTQTDEIVELSQVIIFQFDGPDRFARRIEATQARLEPGAWLMEGVWFFVPERPAQFLGSYRLPTDLTRSRIEDSFASPETISFWRLPEFIRTLEAAGFAASSHRLHFQVMLAAPLLMAAMVLIAASVTMRHARRGGGFFVIVGGVAGGFVMYFVSDIVHALGLSDRAPVVLAAWTPSLAATLIGLALILHLEDG